MLAVAIAALGSWGAGPGDVPANWASHLPLAFVENRGQWRTEARFVARRGGLIARLERGAIALQLERAVEEGRREGVLVRLAFEGFRAAAVIAGEGGLPGTYNFFYGNDPARWVTEVSGHASVLYRGLYAGVDLRVREEDRHLEYDLLLAPGADLGSVVVRLEGIDALRLDPEGILVFETRLGRLLQRPPKTWQVARDGSSVPRECRYRLLEGNRFGFEVRDRDPGLALVVDPGLEWSTFLGGSFDESVRAAATTPSGSVIVAGWTSSPGFPVTAGSYDTLFSPPSQGFVAHLDATGSVLLYSTFLAGTSSAGWTLPFSVALDPSGSATVVGETGSADFPTTPGAFDVTYNGGYSDPFVTRLGPTGSTLTYSTFLGGSSPYGRDRAKAVDLDASGEAIVGGDTGSFDFPTTPGAFSTTLGTFVTAKCGAASSFVARLTSTGSQLAYSTFFGGGMECAGLAGLEVDASGTVTLAGTTEDPALPVTPGAFDTTYNGGGPIVYYDGFVARLTGDGSALVYATYLGGPGWDTIFSMSSGSTGAVTVSGATSSSGFPVTAGAFQTSPGPGFVSRLDPAGGALEWSTFFPGFGRTLTVDSAGSVVIAGDPSTPFPITPGAYDPMPPPPYKGFVSRLDPSGSAVRYSTFLGGTGAEDLVAIALDLSAAITVAGRTTSADFPATPGSLDPTYNGASAPTGGGDGFVSRLDLLPTGVTKYAVSTPGCAGALAIGVTAWPQVGNAAFSLTCTNAPPNALGTLGIAFAPASPLFFVAGALVALDPFATLFLDAASNSLGASEVAISIPPSPALAGGTVYAQFFWGSPCAPGGVSASNALEILVQP